MVEAEEVPRRPDERVCGDHRHNVSLVEAEAIDRPGPPCSEREHSDDDDPSNPLGTPRRRVHYIST